MLKKSAAVVNLSNKCISLKRSSKQVISRLTEANNPEHPNSDYLVSLDSMSSHQVLLNSLAINNNNVNKNNNNAQIINN